MPAGRLITRGFFFHFNFDNDYTNVVITVRAAIDFQTVNERNVIRKTRVYLQVPRDVCKSCRYDITFLSMRVVITIVVRKNNTDTYPQLQHWVYYHRRRHYKYHAVDNVTCRLLAQRDFPNGRVGCVEL